MPAPCTGGVRRIRRYTTTTRRRRPGAACWCSSRARWSSCGRTPAASSGGALQAEVAQARVSRGPRSGRAPVVLALGSADRHVVDRGEAAAHQAARVELPVLVPVRAEPVSGIIVPLVSKAHRDAVGTKRPDLLDEAVVELAVPLALQELTDRLAAAQELGTVAPLGILAVGERYALRIAAVPGVLGHAHLGNRAVRCERRADGRRRCRGGVVVSGHACASLPRLSRPALNAAPASASSAPAHSAMLDPAAA